MIKEADCKYVRETNTIIEGQPVISETRTICGQMRVCSVSDKRNTETMSHYPLLKTNNWEWSRLIGL